MVHHLADLKTQAEHARAIAHEHAAGIVAQAMRDRGRLIGDATDAGKAAGYTEGFEAGRLAGSQEGRKAALDEMKAALREVETQWSAALGEFESARVEMLADARRDVLTLALEIAQRVVKRRIETDPSIAAAQVESVLQKLSRPTRLVVLVNPADEQRVREALPALTQRLVAGVHTELKSDAAIGRGSCVVRSAGGEVDATIATQLERIAEALVPGQASVVAKVEHTTPSDGQPTMERAA